MARSFGKVFTTIWRDDDFRALNATAQRLYLSFISSPDLSHAGVLPLRVSKWAKAAVDLTEADIESDLFTLTAHGFVLTDDDTEEVMVRSFIKNDEGWKNDNMRKAVIAAIEEIESRDLREHAEASLSEMVSEAPPKGVGSPFEGTTQGDPNNYSSSSSLQLATTPAAAAATAGVASVSLTPSLASAAIELLVQHRLNNPDRPIRSRSKYADAIRNDTMRDSGAALNAAEVPEDQDAPRWLAVHVLGLSKSDAAAAASSLRRNRGRAA